MAGTVERKRPWLFEGYKEEEGTAVITLTVPRRLAWGLGMRSKGERVDLGQLCFTALAALVKAKRIPWSWFDEILAAQRAGGQKMASQEGGEIQAIEPTESGESMPLALLELPADEAGGGEGDAQPPARPKVDHAAARAKIGARTGRKAS